MHLGRYQEAFDSLTELNRGGLEASLFNNLGVVQLRRPPDAAGRRAVAYFVDAVALDPADSDLLFNLGLRLLAGPRSPECHSVIARGRSTPSD